MRHIRTITHYGASFLILTVYGGQVCPFVESLSLSRWAASLAVAFTGMLLARLWIVGRLVETAPYEVQSLRQAAVEFGVFAAGGLALALYNYAAYGFPAVSGLSIFLGVAVLSFFVVTDLALERERRIAVTVSRAQRDLSLERRYTPVTRRFTVVAIACAVSVSIVLFLVFSRDLEWLAQLPPERVAPARLVIMAEIVFVMATLLGLLLNLIMSFSRNLGLVLEHENGALMDVAAGNLDARVPVSTTDEFGIMANYTNRMIARLRERTRELLLTQDVTIHGLASLAETRDNETGQHLLRTQRYVRLLAEHLKDAPRFRAVLDDATIDLLFKSAPLHDIGKVGVPDRILLKPGPLSDEEFAVMKNHAVYGRDALLVAEERLGSNSFLRHARDIAYTHHEKWDGNGYPQGLRGEEIPFAGRLMAVADVYDALISKRVYKPAFPHEQAKAIILEGRGVHFDPDIVDAFMTLEHQFEAIAREYADS